MNLFSTPGSRRFLLIFFGVFAAGYLVLLFFPPVFLEDAIARAAGGVLNLPVEENRIQLGEQYFIIGESCTGFVSVLMLSGIVLGLRKPSIKKKWKVILGGGTLLLALNLVRIILVIGIGQKWGMDAAESAHIISWFAVSGLVIGLALFGISRSVPARERNDLL
jgi:exosortase/archaeosortase family protein